MENTPVAEAVTWLEKTNADLQPEMLAAQTAREMLAAYARAKTKAGPSTGRASVYLLS